MSFRESIERMWRRVRDSLSGLAEGLRHRWNYRQQKDPSDTIPVREGAGGKLFASFDRPGWGGFIWRAAVALLAFLILYYSIGMAMVNEIDDNPDFTATAEDAAPPKGSKAVAMMTALIEREVNRHSWTANDPFFQPGALLDNMPNFQTGMVSALARFSFEMTDQVGRTRGSSGADPDLQEAAGLLQYPGDVWLWNPSVSLAIKASSESQYRAARKALLRYNARLDKGEAVFERRSDNLLAAIERMASDLGSASATIDEEVREHSGDFIDTKADDVFYNTKGKLYGYYMILKALGEDFAPVIAERKLATSWEQMLVTFREGAGLDPFIVINGRPDAFMKPSHLASQGFYLLRARTQLREVSNILLK